MLPRAPSRKDLLATHGTGGSAVSSLRICRKLPHLTSCPSLGTLHPATESGGSIQAQPFLLAAGHSDSRQPLLSSHQGFVKPASLTDFYSLPLPPFSGLYSLQLVSVPQRALILLQPRSQDLTPAGLPLLVTPALAWLTVRTL